MQLRKRKAVSCSCSTSLLLFVVHHNAIAMIVDLWFFFLWTRPFIITASIFFHLNEQQMFIVTITQTNKQTINQSVRPSDSPSVCPSVSQSVSQSDSQTVSKSVSQTVSQQVSQWVRQQVSESVHPSESQSIKQIFKRTNKNEATCTTTTTYRSFYNELHCHFGNFVRPVQMKNLKTSMKGTWVWRGGNVYMFKLIWSIIWPITSYWQMPITSRSILNNL